MSAKNGRRMPGSRPRALNLRPLAKAVRGALSVSASALAISLVASPAAEASYPAFCGYDAPTNTAYCNGYSYWDGSQWVVVDTTYDTLTGTELGVEDLTLVVGNSNWTYLRPDYYEEDGILANWGGDITVNVGNYGVIDTYQGNGIVATTGYGGLDDATVVNDGFIRADQDYSNPVAGISVYAADDATVVNNDGIDVNGVNYSTGVAAYALNGDVVVDNNGWIDVVSTSSTAVGIQADGVYAHVSNDGSLQVDSFNGLALGIDVDGESFDVLNTGSIGVSGGQYAFGIDAHGGDGDSSVTNFGSISVDGANDTYGIRAYVDDGDLVINNRGGIDAYSKYDDAYGIYVVGSGGIVSVANRGDITVDGQDNATGIEVGAYYGTRATIVNSGTIDARAERGDAYGMDIDADQGGNIVVTNAGSGAIDAVSDQGQAFGVYVDHDGSGDVTVRNDGRISATTYSNGSYGGEDAFGIYVEASGGSISITNFGEVRATAVDGAEGFYAASGDAIGIAVNSYDGSDVSVRNAGDVVADSWYSDAAGIDIYVDEGGGSVLVRNDRLVSAHSDTANAYGVRVGQYDGGEAASPSDVTLINAGVIYADSVFGNAYGVSIDAGTVDVSNAGVIAAFATIDEGRAAGVSAIGKYGVEFDNSGRIDVQADGAAGTSFFDASAAGAFLLSVGGDVDATNSGSIYSYSHQGDAVGIGGVSYLGGVSITTEAGSLVDVDAGWFAYGNAIGIGAYTFVDGGITIDSAGDVMVRADDSATGIGAGNLKYGDIEITNSGLVDVLARGEAVGIDVEGSDGTITVVNAAGGVIDVESREADAFGIRASSDGGGIEVANYGSITVDANYDATGISASSYSGNVLVVNGGSIDAATAYGDDAIGIEASSVYGDVSVRTQAGSSIAATNATGDATGIDASADSGGQVYVRNDGSITVEGSPYYNDEVYVTGIRAEAGDYFDGGETGGWTLGSVTVRNYGTIDVSGGYDVWGIDASTDQGDILVVNAASGSITLNSGDDSYGGIVAHSNGGDITAANLGDITVDSAEDAYGIAVNAGQDGNVYVFNSGAIDVAANSTYSYYYYGGDEAIGIEARVGSGDLDVVTTGTITVASASGDATGVFASSYNGGDVYVYNAGAISVTADEEAVGVGAFTAAGDVAVISVAGASISATGEYDATGILVGSSYFSPFGTDGDVYVYNGGSVTATAGEEAYGLLVDANHGNVAVVNAGGFAALGYYGAYGIDASSSYGDVSVSSVTPGATIVATAEYGDATGISAFARYGGAVDVLNEGAITATVSADFYDYATATGIQAEAGDSYYDGAWTNGTVEVRNTGAITATSGYNAFGIDASSSGGDIAAFNGGSITAVGYEAAGIHVVSASGDVRVDGGEGGSIEVTADYAARGIWASTGGAGTVTVANASSITAVSGDYADGILAYSNSGAVNVSNSGAITVSASDFASGIYAASEYGDVSARNLTGGSISATSAYDIAAGIYAYSNYGGDVDVLNQGSITVDGGEYAAGIYAAAGDRFDGSAWDYGSVEVRNSGSIEATSDQLGAWGILASADGGDVLVVNASSGSISAYADSASGYGIGADAVDGDVSVSNFGRVFAYGEYEAAGIDANSTFGDVGVFSLNTVDPVTGSVLTSPEIYAVAKYGYADGIAAFSVSGDVTVANDGRIGAYSFYSDATGVRAQSVFGDVSVHGGAGAFITADSYAADATGISAIASNGGAVHVLNQGDIVADGEKYATGIFAQAGDYFDGGESGGWVVGTVEVHNSGDIEATAREYDAYGVRALTYGGDILVSNAATGSITATAVYSDAYGIEARSTGGDIDVVNLGSIAAFGDSDAYGVLAASRDGDVGVFNLNTLDPVTGAVVSSGEIHAHAVYDNAVGIDAFSYNGNVTVANEGGIDAYADRDLAIGVGAHSVFGDVSVLNYAGASIMAESGGWDATGVDAYSAAGGSVYVLNEGAIEVEAADDARGIYAGTYGGDVGVFNDGSIDATSVYGDATGIDVRADSGGQAYVRNDGTITVEASQYYGDEAYATGIRAEAGDYFDGGENGGGTYGSVTVRNYGSIDVSGGYDVWGIDASTDQGDILVVNAASGSITLNSGDDSYGGIVARSNGGDITAVNLGDITIDSDEDAYGIAVYAGQGGDAYVYNSGAIDVAANSTFLYGGDEAIGIEARVGSGYLEVVNTGTITVASASGDATGVFASSYGGGEIYVYNSDAISVAAHEEAVGVGAYNTAGDVAVISVAGASISATGGYDATGIVAETKYGDVYVVNEASIDALADEGRAAGIEVTTGAGAYYAFAGGDIGVYNDGDVHAVSMDGFAVGIRAQAGGYGDVYVGNDGTVRAQAEGDAIGIGAYAMAGDVEVFASGNVTAVSTSSTGDADSAGIRAESDFYYGGGDVYVGVDSGTVVSATSTASATGADAYAAGIQAFAYGDVTVVNDGTVTGSATASLVAAASRNAYAAGMYLSSAYGDIAVYNDGTIRATATAFDGLAAAVYLNGEYATLVENHGTLTATGSDFSHAVLSIGASDDTVLNYGTMTGSIVTEGGDDLVVNDGTWNTLGSSDLGDNNDVVFNTADGVINMTNTSIDLGGWSALPPPPSGKSGLRQAPISGIAGNQFVNDGLIVVRGDGVIDMGALNPNAFVNNGIVDFDDGLPNDALTVYGNLAGDGDLLVDLNAATGASDMLYVEGNVVSGTRMRVNGHMDTMPTSADDRIDIMRVSGTSTANVLTVGDITTNADSFVTFGFGVVASINTANTADDVHSLAVSVTGLTGRGALLASLAPAMQNYWHDSLGSLTRRTGVAEPQELGVPTAWVRGFTSDGEVNPELSSGFGSGSTADFDQKLSGTEFGIDVGVTETLRFGLMVSKGDSTVRIADVGSAEIDVDNVGVYATWLGSSGFYVDATYRQMEFETRLRSGSYDDRPDASADGFSLEAGYAWKLDGGLVLKPELLYSQVKVDSLDTISNSYGEFGLADGDSSRLRAGLTMNKTYGDKGKHWTPYAGLFYLTEMDGKNTFDVNGDFQGDVDMNGNSFIGELGVTGQFGKWVLSGGVNYQDGGAFNGVLGGQLAIRYAF